MHCSFIKYSLVSSSIHQFHGLVSCAGVPDADPEAEEEEDATLDDPEAEEEGSAEEDEDEAPLEDAAINGTEARCRGGEEAGGTDAEKA